MTITKEDFIEELKAYGLELGNLVLVNGPVRFEEDFIRKPDGLAIPYGSATGQFYIREALAALWHFGDAESAADFIYQE